jgi:hypothetical protein
MCARTHLMFSHTAKGQTYNTALLSRFVGNNPAVANPLPPRLIDYEHLTDDDGKRTVGFGWFAGGMELSWCIPIIKWRVVAGVLESLSAMAHSHLEIGVASPFIVRLSGHFACCRPEFFLVHTAASHPSITGSATDISERNRPKNSERRHSEKTWPLHYWINWVREF